MQELKTVRCLRVPEAAVYESVYETENGRHIHVDPEHGMRIQCNGALKGGRPEVS